ncbi:MAG TPA: uroporphyrinogen decarboxylase family protein [Fimbriimonadaceae bacterium]|nr:uroporphyrinogen decarboxylase family protein [Fimbriimonadaceae bacterium]
MPSLDKRAVLLDLLDPAKKQEYVPAGFFLHFDPAFHSGRAAVEKHIEFFRETGMDFVKVQFEVPFPHMVIDSPGDWESVPRMDRAFYEPQIQVVQGLVEALGGEALVVVTLYSPFMIAAHIGGQDRLGRHLEENLAAVRPGLERITDGLLDFVRGCIGAGVDGFYHSTQGGESRRFADLATFEQGVKPYDLAVMKEIEAACRFNILHICDYYRADYGGYDDLTLFLDYPGHVVNCAIEEGMTANMISAMFGRPFMGGMDRTGVLASGTEEEVREAARQVLASRPERFILGADCTVPGTTPWANLRAAIDEAHKL